MGEIPIRKGFVVSVACCYIILKFVFTELGEKANRQKCIRKVDGPQLKQIDTSVKSRDTTFWQVRASKNSHCSDASTPLITQVCVLFQHHSEATLLSSCDSSVKRSTDSHIRQVIRNLIAYTKA